MDKGIVLIGEAATQFVQYKYVELFTVSGILVLICVGVFILLMRNGR